MSDTTYIVNIYICPTCDEVFESLAPGVICADCRQDCGVSVGWFEYTKEEYRRKNKRLQDQMTENLARRD